jgi:hypothetical protein
VISKRKTCSGKLILTTLLPKVIKKDYLTELRNLGFVDYPLYTQKNLLKLYKDDIVFQGSFFNKSVSIYCNSNRPDVECEELAKQAIESLVLFLKGKP